MSVIRKIYMKENENKGWKLRFFITKERGVNNIVEMLLGSCFMVMNVQYYLINNYCILQNSTFCSSAAFFRKLNVTNLTAV